MRSPLAPVLANIFMGFYVSKWLNEYNLNKLFFMASFSKAQNSFKVIYCDQTTIETSRLPAI